MTDKRSLRITGVLLKHFKDVIIDGTTGIRQITISLSLYGAKEFAALSAKLNRKVSAAELHEWTQKQSVLI